MICPHCASTATTDRPDRTELDIGIGVVNLLSFDMINVHEGA